MRADADELTMLLVAEGERLAPALRERLVKHGLNVHECSRATVADTAFVVAPDLVVLAGTAAEDGGLDVLAALAARPATAGLPVVVIGDPGRLGDRPSTFRHGIVAVIERTASADELARRIAEVAQELPERTGESSGAIDAGGVRELVELLAESLRTGILSVTGPDGVSARVVLRADRPASEVISQIVERLRPLADAPEGVRYEFHESPTGKFGALESTGKFGSLDLGGDDDAAALAELPRSRLLIIEQNPSRADLLAQGLRAQGARVAVADGVGRGLELARDLAPDVVIVDGNAVDDWALEALRKIRRDRSLRWASLLLVDASQLWHDERRPDIATLAASIGALMRSDRELARRLVTETTVGTRLEVLGPVRTLRTLAETKLGLRMHVQHPRIVVDLDLSDGILVGASARLPNASGTAAEGPAALATLLGLSSGRVQIERAEAPRSTNIMSPVDDAIAVAAQEEPVVALSQPPPSLAPPEPKLPPQSKLPREAGDVARLVTHLEQLLGELREHAEPGAPAATSSDAQPVAPVLRPVLAVGTPNAPPAEPRPRSPVLAEETTSTVGFEEIARLRRQMRDSSQRLLAVVPPPAAAALPAPPLRSRKPTLVGVAIDVALPPATPYVAKSPTGTLAGIALPPEKSPPSPTTSPGIQLPPEKSSASSTSPGAYSSKPSALGPPPAKLPPPKPASAVARPKGADLPASPAPEPERAKSASLGAPSPFGATQLAPAAAPLSAAKTVPAPSPIASALPAPASAPAAPAALTAPVVPAPPAESAPSSGFAPMPFAQSAGPNPGAEPSATPHEFLELDSAELVSQPPPVVAPPSFFSLIEPPVSTRSPAVSAASSPRPPEPVEARALSPSDITPMPEKLAASQARSKLPLFLAVSVLGLAVLVGLAFFVYSRVTAPRAPVASIVVGGPLPVPVPLPVVPPVIPPLGAGAGAPPVGPGEGAPPPPRPSGTVFGPGPSEPVEGSPADFDLGRLHIEPLAPPTSRRIRASLFGRLLRQANQARRQHRLDEAEQIYLRVLAMDAENGRASAGLSLIHLEREQPTEAIFWAQRLVRLQSIYASNWVLLGDTLRLGNNPDAARRAYLRAIIEQASNATARERLQELDGGAH